MDMQIDTIKLKTLLFKEGLRQWQLAKEIGIHETNFSKIMTGRLEPGKDLVKKICRVLKINEDGLVLNNKRAK